jgi:hypothetical protein
MTSTTFKPPLDLSVFVAPVGADRIRIGGWSMPTADAAKLVEDIQLAIAAQQKSERDKHYGS